MQKLEKLVQDDYGLISRDDGEKVSLFYLFPVAKIKTLVLENPHLDVADEINKMAERNSFFIPKRANSFVVSDFSGDTQHPRSGENGTKMFSVYAVQFYYVLDKDY